MMKPSLIRYCYRVLRPLVRFLLRQGVPFAAFAEVARQAYVDEARTHPAFRLPGRKQTDARVAVLTGLHRKEVARLSQPDGQAERQERQQYNRAMRVVRGWRQDPDFCNAQGPRPLPIEGEQGFYALARRYSGDMPPRAVLDELLRTGMVRDQGSGLTLTDDTTYLPDPQSEQALLLARTAAADLLETLDHNLSERSAAKRYQRMVAYDHLDRQDLPAIRQRSQQEAQALLVQLNDWLRQYDRDARPDQPAVAPDDRMRAGIGIYYFETPYPEQDLGDE